MATEIDTSFLDVPGSMDQFQQAAQLLRARWAGQRALEAVALALSSGSAERLLDAEPALAAAVDSASRISAIDGHQREQLRRELAPAQFCHENVGHEQVEVEILLADDALLTAFTDGERISAQRVHAARRALPGATPET